MVRINEPHLLKAHLPFLHLSDDDHSYFVRWKLPTETLEIFDENKWLGLSSSIIIKLIIFNMDLQQLIDWPIFIGKELSRLSSDGNTFIGASLNMGTRT